MKRREDISRFNDLVEQALEQRVKLRAAKAGQITVVSRYLLHYRENESLAKRNQQSRVKVRYEQTGKTEIWYCFTNSSNPAWGRN
jgi:hypothetical protein